MTGLDGVYNSAKPGSGKTPKNYLQDYKPVQFTDGPGLKQIITPNEGRLAAGDGAPFCYVSGAPRNNAKTFDLWVDIYVGNDILRISNWSDEPEEVSY